MKKWWLGTKLGIVAATLGVCAFAVHQRLAPPAPAIEPKPEELYQVVLQEIAAVKTADYPKAYRQVSLSMQERYNLGDFAERLRFERPELGRFERVEFGGIVARDRHALLPVYFFLRTGDVALVHYTFVLEEGTWKIDGSQVDRRWERGHLVGGDRT